MNNKKLWIALGIVIGGSFLVLGGVGYKMITARRRFRRKWWHPTGASCSTGHTIQDGQGVWQSIGGQEIGSMWGHGAYVAPDWTADWLRREAEGILNIWAREQNANTFAALSFDQQAVLKARFIRAERTNT